MNKKRFNSYSLNLKLNIHQLLLVNAHLGHVKRFLNVKVKPYLLGYRSNLYLLNITNTLYQFKIFVNVLINIISRRKKLLVIKQYSYIDFKLLMDLPYAYYYDNKWIGGILTNFKNVRSTSSINKQKTNLIKMKTLPSLIFFFDINLSDWGLMEALNLDIPTAGLIDTNSGLVENINYPIICNNKSFEINFLYFKMIKNAILKGRQKEVFKILRII